MRSKLKAKQVQGAGCRQTNLDSREERLELWDHSEVKESRGGCSPGALLQGNAGRRGQIFYVGLAELQRIWG